MTRFLSESLLQKESQQEALCGLLGTQSSKKIIDKREECSANHEHQQLASHQMSLASGSQNITKDESCEEPSLKIEIESFPYEEEENIEDFENVGSLDMDSSEYTCQDPGLSFDKETEKKIKEFQDELIENPVTPKDIKYNQKIDKKIRYEKAVVAVTSGQIKNCRVASNLYGVKYRTVLDFISKKKNSGQYQGGGRKLERFTREEEKFITGRINRLVQNGAILTTKLIQQVVVEEAQVILANNPDRSETLQKIFDKKTLPSFVSNFSKRNRLNYVVCDAKKKKDLCDADMKKEMCDADKKEELDESRNSKSEELSTKLEIDSFLAEKDEDIIEEDVDLDKGLYTCQDPEEVTFDKETEEKIKDFEGELIENPSTLKDRKFNQRIDKKIRYEKAVAAVISGQIRCRVAAEHYGVAYSTVRDITSKSKRSSVGRNGYYQGRGMILKRFTREEEKYIADRIKKLVENGAKMTKQLIKEVVIEEAEVVKINHPERSEAIDKILDKKLFNAFISNFSNRQRLNHLCDVDKKRELEEKRNFECEVCYKKFCYKNARMLHMRTCHGFLFS